MALPQLHECKCPNSHATVAPCLRFPPWATSMLHSTTAYLMAPRRTSFLEERYSQHKEASLEYSAAPEQIQHRERPCRAAVTRACQASSHPKEQSLACTMSPGTRRVRDLKVKNAQVDQAKCPRDAWMHSKTFSLVPWGEPAVGP